MPLRNQVENGDDIGTASETGFLGGGDLEVEVENVMSEHEDRHFIDVAYLGCSP